MVSLIGVPLHKDDLENIEQSLQSYKRGEISAGEYNAILLEIKIRNTKPPSALQLLKSAPGKLGTWIKERVSRPEMLAEREVYRERLQACSVCEHQMHVASTNVKLCRLCGCVLQAKARLNNSRCPAPNDGQGRNGKWKR
mgnify:CR=1 FL=1|tara:strand:- start:404 stop:823 length:420 start_codon:yes stop_codon:yes gene_type:complete